MIKLNINPKIAISSLHFNAEDEKFYKHSSDQKSKTSNNYPCLLISDQKLTTLFDDHRNIGCYVGLIDIEFQGYVSVYLTCQHAAQGAVNFFNKADISAY